MAPQVPVADFSKVKDRLSDAGFGLAVLAVAERLGDRDPEVPAANPRASLIVPKTKRKRLLHRLNLVLTWPF
jgi:hypothetical protein